MLNGLLGAVQTVGVERAQPANLDPLVTHPFGGHGAGLYWLTLGYPSEGYDAALQGSCLGTEGRCPDLATAFS